MGAEARSLVGRFYVGQVLDIAGKRFVVTEAFDDSAVAVAEEEGAA